LPVCFEGWLGFITRNVLVLHLLLPEIKTDVLQNCSRFRYANELPGLQPSHVSLFALSTDRDYLLQLLLELLRILLFDCANNVVTLFFAYLPFYDEIQEHEKKEIPRV